MIKAIADNLRDLHELLFPLKSMGSMIMHVIVFNEKFEHSFVLLCCELNSTLPTQLFKSK